MKMESNYKKLGLSPNATKEQVEEQYIKLMRIYENQNVAEPSQRAFAEKSKREITRAYNEIISSYNNKTTAGGGYQSRGNSAGAYATAPEYESATKGEYRQADNTAYQSAFADKKEMYADVRRLIQSGNYKTASSLLENNRYETDAEWNYLMGSALYFSGYVSKSYSYFDNAVRLAPDNREYAAVYNRLNSGRKGKVYNSPYRDKSNSRDLDKACNDSSGIIGLILCRIICCN